MPLAYEKTYAIVDASQIADELMGALEEVKTEIMTEIRFALTNTARRLTAERLPSGGGSYRYMFEWRENRSRPDHWTGILFNRHEWAEAVEFGTSPHLIIASPGRRLHITKKLPRPRPPYGTRYISVDIMRRMVHHPGARPFRILTDTHRVVADRLTHIIEEGLRRAGFRW